MSATKSGGERRSNPAALLIPAALLLALQPVVLLAGNRALAPEHQNAYVFNITDTNAPSGAC